MSEPFYGSVASSPIWSGIAPAFGVFQGPLGVGVGHGEGFGSPLIPQAPVGGLPSVAPGFASPGGHAGLPQGGYASSPVGYVAGNALIPAGAAGLPVGQTPGVASVAYVGPGSYAGFGGIEPSPGISAHALLAAIALRRGQPQGPANDQEIEEFLYDALELLPGTNDVEVRCDAGRVTLTGSVQQKRLKRDVGEIAWAIPSINDVTNNVTIATRRRPRVAGREGEAHQTTASGRKQG